MNHYKVLFLLVFSLVVFTPQTQAAMTYGATTATSDGNYTLDGITSSAFSFGPSITTGSIVMGSGLTSGTITIGGASQSGNIILGPTGATSKIGIGTSSPRTRLELGNDGAVLAIGTYGSGWTEPNLGAGTRMIWYPRKAAFRVGNISGTKWNNVNIGNYSIAMGSDTTASADYSTAMGDVTTASGDASTAMGSSTTASADYSTAMGSSTTASGISSVAMGESTQAAGNNSVAMGLATATGSYASVAMGKYNVGGGTAGSWVATEALFEIGIGTDYGNKANALTVLKNGNVGIGTATPGASNLLDLTSTTKGFVLPRMTKAQRDAIATPVAGMMIYQTDNTPGLRVYNATNWMRFTETAD